MKKILIGSLCTLVCLATTSQAHGDSTRAHGGDRKPYRSSRKKTTDLLHTRLEVRFDWQKAQLHGKAAITARPHFRGSSTLTLDAKGMDIHSLEVYDLGAAGKNIGTTQPELLKAKKVPATFQYENDSIKIRFGKHFRPDETYQVRITYTAKPNELKPGGSNAIASDKGLYFINPTGADKNKMPQIWTQGETQASSAWFPTIDSPNEKMTNEILMTVDDKYTTLSNGKLVASRKHPDGTRTDHWKMDLPHSPYLVMMGVGEFVKVTDAPWHGKEVSYYVEKEYAPFAKQIFGSTGEMMTYYSRLLGVDYPWQKYAQIVVRDYVSGAMENTSATVHGDFMVYQTAREMIDGKKGEAVIAHELFHQWFGNLVTAESWSQLPLNESFATYGEYLWEEYKNGRDAADAHGYKSRMGYFQQSQEQVELIRYHYDRQEDMFDVFSYNKGGQVLHMLRKYTGDSAFFSALRLYLDRNRFQAAEIHHLRLAFEEVTGEDLNWFFNQWFLEKGHPKLEVTARYDSAAGAVRLTVEQRQDPAEAPVYQLPVDVDVYRDGGRVRHRIVITDPTQEFLLPAAGVPDLVNFDAERQLLAQTEYKKSTGELLFQYRNAPLFGDRLEAISQLKNVAGEPGVAETLLQAAVSDPWFELRGLALNALKPVAQSQEQLVRPVVAKMAVSDANTNVRALAVGYLSANYADTSYLGIYLKGTRDPSYKVVAASLRALNNTNDTLAMREAALLQDEKNQDVFQAVAAVLAKNGSDADYGYFEERRDDYSGFGVAGWLSAVGHFLQVCADPETFRKAARHYQEIANGDNVYLKPFAAKGLNEQVIRTVKLNVVRFKDSDPDRSAAFATLAAELDRLAAGQE